MDWIKAMVMKRRYQEEIAKLNATDNEEIYSLYDEITECVRGYCKSLFGKIILVNI